MAQEKEQIEQLEARVKALGIRVLEKRIARLEGRKWFLFLRVKWLLRKVRLLKGEA